MGAVGAIRQKGYAIPERRPIRGERRGWKGHSLRWSTVILNTSSSKPKSHLPTVCNPTSPTCCDSGLPTQITSHRTESTGSSKTSSTSCPRLSLKLPFNLKPSWDLSTIRQGNIFWTPLRLKTRLARCFVVIRLDRRSPEIGTLGIDSPHLTRNPVYGLR